MGYFVPCSYSAYLGSISVPAAKDALTLGWLAFVLMCCMLNIRYDTLFR